MNLSDDEEQASKRIKSKKMQKGERKRQGGKVEKHYVEVDTNVFQVNLDSLKMNTELATGDAEACKGC